MSLFPMFLKLARRPCLVVGAGAVGEAKIRSLLAAGARVRVVAPRATPAIARWARSGKTTWEAREFVPADLAEMFLVIVATSSAELNAWVFREARRRGVLCNAVDDPAHCDFYYPAVVRRGHLQIAVSTGGRSPALARRLRHELEEQFAPDYAAWVARLGKARQKLLGKVSDAERRGRLLQRLASGQAFEQFIRGRKGKLRRRSAP